MVSIDANLASTSVRDIESVFDNLTPKKRTEDYEIDTVTVPTYDTALGALDSLRC